MTRRRRPDRPAGGGLARHKSETLAAVYRTPATDNRAKISAKRALVRRVGRRHCVTVTASCEGERAGGDRRSSTVLVGTRRSASKAPPSASRRLRRRIGSKVDAVAYYLPGKTALGVPVGKGVVAVDPKLIPLGTKLHVPGYGPGPRRGRRATRSRVASSTSGSRRRRRPEQLGPAHRHDHHLPVATRPPSAACGTQFTHRRVLERLSSLRSWRSSARWSRRPAASPAARGGSGSGAAHAGRRLATAPRPSLSICVCRQTVFSPRTPMRHSAGVGRGSSGSRSPRCTCSAPASASIPRSSASAPGLGAPGAATSPRRFGDPDPHPGGSELVRTPRRGNRDQASRRSRARRRHVLRHATGTRSAGSRRTSGSSRGHCRRSPSAGFRSRV